VTSLSGSADVLEALGIRVELTPEEVGGWLRDYGFAFLFAPKFHPAFKHIGPARRLCADRGQRTIFNLLGPLLNPARPAVQLLGVAVPSLCRPLAEVLQSLGVRRALVVCGQVPVAAGAPGGAPAWLDEISTLGPTTVAEFHHDRALSEEEFDLHQPSGSVQPARLADLEGGDREANAETLRRIFRGLERGPKRDAVLLNAGAALFVAGAARSIGEGQEQAAKTVDSGKAWAHLELLVKASRG
jgi:anthranilate phosphoribosyltransferase